MAVQACGTLTNTQRVDLTNFEETARGAVTPDGHRGVVRRAPGRDQGADVDVPLDDAARKRCHDALPRRELLEPTYVRDVGRDGRFGRRHGRLRGSRGRDALIDGFLRDRVFGIGRLIARHRHARQIEVGLLQLQHLLGLVQVGTRLTKLLVDLGRRDFGQELTGLDVIADVGVALAEVPSCGRR